MKKIILILTVIIVSITLSSCFKSPEQKVKDAVVKYIENNTNDKSKFESISFDKPVYGKWNTMNFGNVEGYSVHFKYREADDLGNVLIKNEMFIVGNDFKVFKLK